MDPFACACDTLFRQQGIQRNEQPNVNEYSSSDIYATSIPDGINDL
jgi:hypothetical protein